MFQLKGVDLPELQKKFSRPSEERYIADLDSLFWLKPFKREA